MFFRGSNVHLLSLALCFSAALGQYYDDPEIEPNLFDYDSVTTTETEPDAVNGNKLEFHPPSTAVATTTTTVAYPASNRMSEFQMEFWSFEKRMESIVGNIRRNQLATLSGNIEFRKEIREYVSRLQNKIPRHVTVKYRDMCDCDGELNVSPCPERCLYSCSRHNDQYGWPESFNDCKFLKYYGQCTCYQDSNIDCNSDIEKNCIQEKIVNTTEGDANCSEYAPDEEKIIKSNNLFVNLIVEPLRMFYRGIESRLTLLRQSAASIEHLSRIATLVCSNQSDAICVEEAPHLLRLEMQNVRALKKNITLEMIKAQDEIDVIAKSVNHLKEQTFAQVIRSTKEFACCLKALNFTVEGYDCHPALITELPSTPKPFASKYDSICPPTVSFLCTNRNCIPRTLTCNGQDDCGDLSDEEVCLESV